MCELNAQPEVTTADLGNKSDWKKSGVIGVTSTWKRICNLVSGSSIFSGCNNLLGWEALTKTQVLGFQGLKGGGCIALVAKTCCDEAFDSVHLVLFGLQVPETLLVHNLLDLDSVDPDPHQQSLKLQECHHNMVWQLTRVLILLPVRSWAAATHIAA